jgi:hypothetical protein
MLCFATGFDLIDDPLSCPTERNSLKEFYDSAKGTEWTHGTNWTDPYIGHCWWYGITCNDSNNTVKLELRSNGLSGTLTPHIANLSALKVLNLTDNNIKVRQSRDRRYTKLKGLLFLNLTVFIIFNQGSIPAEIGSLSNLTHLRLSSNEFIGNVTDLIFPQRLQLIHLHGNRLHGTMPEMVWLQPTKNWRKMNDSVHIGLYGFVSDRGQPSDFNPSLVCDSCTMCCKPCCRFCLHVSSNLPRVLTHLSLAFVECF